MGIIIISIIIDPPPPPSNNTGTESTRRRRDISLGVPPPITCLCRVADKTSIKILTNTSMRRGGGGRGRLICHVRY